MENHKYFWNSAETTMYYNGVRPLKKGEEIPEDAACLKSKETMEEYIEKGLIVPGKVIETEEEKHARLYQEAKDLDLKPRRNFSIEKLEKMISEANNATEK